MERALTEPGLGYYATSSRRPTRSGDFLTAPELHPFFGRCVGRLLAGAWRALGKPERLVVREWGAGRGPSPRTRRTGLVADGSPLAGRLDWQPVDLPGRHPEPPAGPFSGVGLANELLDALPVHRVGRRDGRLVERYVTWQDGWFAEVPGGALHAGARGAPGGRRRRPGGGTAGRGRPRSHGVAVGSGGATWSAAGCCSSTTGTRPPSSTGHGVWPARCVTYRGHEVGGRPVRAVGRQDITAHVDVTALLRAAAEAGLAEPGETSQARFLAALGLGDMLTSLGRAEATDVAAYIEARVGRRPAAGPPSPGRLSRHGLVPRGLAAGLPLPGFEPPGRGG